MRARLPPHRAGLRIGLYGGSFNPPHAGHRHVSLLALRRLRLDRLWWIVTPGNPLKETKGLPSLPERMALARRVAAHPRIAVTGFEAEIGARFTLDTLSYLKARAPGVRWVWIMGADNLATFHRWRGWREIAGLMPIAVVDRPGATFPALASPAAKAFAQGRVEEQEAASLPCKLPPAWVFLHGPRSFLSSTRLRQQAAVEMSRSRGQSSDDRARLLDRSSEDPGTEPADSAAGGP